MKKRVVLINPNSSKHVTEAMARSVAPHATADLEIDCLTLEEGPPAISGYGDRHQVTAPLLALLAREQESADAFVIACFGDPGLLAAREAFARPVFGMGECSFYAAMALGDRFGIMSTGAASIRRHIRYVRELGISGRLVGDRPIDMSMSALEEDPEGALERLLVCGVQLREDGAEVLITGCAGMARYRRDISAALGLPVVEPAYAAVGFASSAARLRASDAQSN